MRAGLRWLLDLQNRDGGIPTFCKGWGTLPFDRSGSDLTAHAVRAWLTWEGKWADLDPALERAIRRALSYLEREQRENGAFVPLWFGNEAAPGEENPVYGTARALLALEAASGSRAPRVESMMGRALRFLLSARNADGGWGGDRGGDSSIEETALALLALARCRRLSPSDDLEDAIARGVGWLIQTTRRGQDLPPSAIGFYFAKLWYSEKLYPVTFTLAALNELHPRESDSLR